MVKITPVTSTQGITIETARKKFIEKVKKEQRVRKPKIVKKKGFKFPKTRKFRPTGIKLPSVSKISESQVSKSLMGRRLRTAQRVLDSNASPVAKARARRILGV